MTARKREDPAAPDASALETPGRFLERGEAAWQAYLLTGKSQPMRAHPLEQSMVVGRKCVRGHPASSQQSSIRSVRSSAKPVCGAGIDAMSMKFRFKSTSGCGRPQTSRPRAVTAPNQALRAPAQVPAKPSVSFVKVLMPPGMLEARHRADHLRHGIGADPEGFSSMRAATAPGSAPADRRHCRGRQRECTG